MEDYARTLVEFDRRFATDAACRDYLFRLRWPDGGVCPRCEGRRGWLTTRGLWACGACGYQASVMAGTIFQDTRHPLTLWFRAIWWVTSQKTGASALGVQRVLGFGRYETAWTWLHKLRRAMVRPGRERLAGRVELDDAYVGGVEPGVSGRRTATQALIVVAAHEAGTRIGRIRMRRVPDASAESLHPVGQAAIAPGSGVHTDGWSGYGRLVQKGYGHAVTPLRKRKIATVERRPRVHRVVALLKRGLLGTHQGAASPAHLDYSPDELTFRLNRRPSRARRKLFYRLVQQALLVDPAPYTALIKHARGPKPRAHKT